jgi:hypothetical protein
VLTAEDTIMNNDIIGKAAWFFFHMTPATLHMVVVKGCHLPAGLVLLVVMVVVVVVVVVVVDGEVVGVVIVGDVVVGQVAGNILQQYRA